MQSSTNTILLVVVIALLVGFGAWYFTKNKAASEDKTPGLHIELTGTKDTNE